MLSAGVVTINEETGEGQFVPPVGPNLARELFEARLAVTELPDPDNKPGGSTTRTTLVGETVIEIDSTAGFRVGTSVAFLKHSAKIASKTATTLTLKTPSPVVIPAGTVIGFQGTANEWREQALPQVVKVKKQLAAYATADASAFLAHVRVNGQAKFIISAGGLQRTPDPNDPNTPTAAPASPVEVIGSIE